ncbi:MAG: DNA glycosylase AlkZ-like family protein [Bacillota bacterium]
MYQPDLPKAERRLHAFNLDRSQLRDLLGQAALRDLLDEQAIADAVARARWMTDDLRPASADQLHTWLLRVGELHRDDPLWADTQVSGWLRILRGTGRALEVQVGSAPVWIPTEYAPDFAAAVGTPEGKATPEIAAAQSKLTLRYARSHGPFTASELAQVYGWSVGQAERLLAGLESEGFVDHGEYLPHGSGVEWCDRELLRQIHRRSLAKARHEVEPRTAEEYASFLARWQGIGGQQSGSEALLTSLQPLLGLYLPAKLWEEYILPARVADYKPVFLDQLVGGGLLQWLAWGDGDAMRLALFNPGEAQPCNSAAVQALSPTQERIMATLRERGALFLPQLWSASGLGPNETLTELFTLIALGQVTNDTLGPIRLLLSHGPNPKRGWNVNQSMLSRMGRWGLVTDHEATDPEPLLQRLFLRHGILTREVINREGLVWSEIGAILERWEMIGKAKRGYFVTGLSGMQYADGRAVDNLRLGVETGLPEYLVLACQDPANPWGQQLPWPETSTVRLVAPSLVVLQRGNPILAVMGDKKLKLVAFGKLSAEQLHAALGELVAFLIRTPAGKRKLTVIEYNGQPVRETEAGPVLENLEFKPDYTSLTRWGR